MKRVPSSVLATAIADEGERRRGGRAESHPRRRSPEPAATWPTRRRDRGPRRSSRSRTHGTQFIDALANSATIQGAIKPRQQPLGHRGGTGGRPREPHHETRRRGGRARRPTTGSSVRRSASGRTRSTRPSTRSAAAVSNFAPGGLFGGEKPADVVAPGDNPERRHPRPERGRHGGQRRADRRLQRAAGDSGRTRRGRAGSRRRGDRSDPETHPGPTGLQRRTRRDRRAERIRADRSSGKARATSPTGPPCARPRTRPSATGSKWTRSPSRSSASSARALAEATEAEKARNKAAGGGAKKQKEVNVELERRKALEKEVADLTRLRSELEESIVDRRGQRRHRGRDRAPRPDGRGQHRTDRRHRQHDRLLDGHGRRGGRGRDPQAGAAERRGRRRPARRA